MQGVRTPGLESRPCHSLAVGLGASYLTGCGPEGWNTTLLWALCRMPWTSQVEDLRLSHLRGQAGAQRVRRVGWGLGCVENIALSNADSVARASDFLREAGNPDLCVNFSKF